MRTPATDKPLRRTPAQWLRRHRRLVIAALLFIAVAASLRALAPDTGPTVRVLAPVHDLPAGHVIAKEDVTTVQLAGTTDRKATSGSAVIGRRLAVPWPAGTPLHSKAMAGGDAARHLPAGQVAVGLQPGPGVPVAFIRPGDEVDVIVTTGESEQEQRSSTVAHAATVLSVSGLGDAGSNAWSGDDGSDDPVIVVAVPRADAATLSSAPRRGPISLVVSG
jgi:Flp pilus assembly protein CpaB